MFQFDWSISLGNVISFVTIAFASIWFLSGIKHRLKAAEEDLHEIKDSVKEVSTQVITTLVSIGKLQSIEERLSLLITRVDNLRDKVN